MYDVIAAGGLKKRIDDLNREGGGLFEKCFVVSRSCESIDGEQACK